jgi:hypothetical protein
VSNTSTVLAPGGSASEPANPQLKTVESELRGDQDLLADGLERFADELLVRERPVHVCGVEEDRAAFDCRPDLHTFGGTRRVGFVRAYSMLDAMTGLPAFVRMGAWTSLPPTASATRSIPRCP